MTNVPEAYLAKEAGMAFACIGMVTDYDCWKEEHCSLSEIMDFMKKNNESAKKLLLELIPSLGSNLFDFEQENQAGILTPRDRFTKEQELFISVLLK